MATLSVNGDDNSQWPPYCTCQIWVGETHVGGCDDLWALERSGQLDSLIKAEGLDQAQIEA